MEADHRDGAWQRLRWSVWQDSAGPGQIAQRWIEQAVAMGDIVSANGDEAPPTCHWCGEITLVLEHHEPSARRDWDDSERSVLESRLSDLFEFCMDPGPDGWQFTRQTVALDEAAIHVQAVAHAFGIDLTIHSDAHRVATAAARSWHPQRQVSANGTHSGSPRTEKRSLTLSQSVPSLYTRIKSVTTSRESEPSTPPEKGAELDTELRSIARGFRTAMTRLRAYDPISDGKRTKSLMMSRRDPSQGSPANGSPDGTTTGWDWAGWEQLRLSLERQLSVVKNLGGAKSRKAARHLLKLSKQLDDIKAATAKQQEMFERAGQRRRLDTSQIEAMTNELATLSQRSERLSKLLAVLSSRTD